MKTALTVLLLGLLGGLAGGGAYPLQSQTVPPPPSGSPWSYGLGWINTCDGMVLPSVRYQGTQAFGLVSLPYVHVLYSPLDHPGGQFWDDLCEGLMPGPVVRDDYFDGFELRATYIFNVWPDPGSYKYVQRYRFWNDGGFAPWLEVYGPGFGPSASYYTYWRLDADIVSASGNNLTNWLGFWSQRIIEENFPDDGINAPDGNEWGIYQGTRNWYVNPATFARDNAGFPALIYKSTELVQGGSGDPGAHASPYTFITQDTELIQNADIVAWYVAHADTVADACSTTAPCIPGFVSKFNGYP